MTDGDALIQTIREHPDDDTPRLLYADWLEEHADGPYEKARALFIRLQCEAARLEPDDPHLPGYQKLIEEIRTACAGHWLAPLVDMGWVDWEQLHFSRGFLSSLLVLTEHFDFAELGDRFLTREPVEAVNLAGPPDTVAAAAGQPSVGLLRTLRLILPEVADANYRPGRGDGAVEAVARVGRRTPLRTFAVTRSGLSDRAAQVLASSPAFAALQNLTLIDVRFTADGLNPFRNAVFAPGIESVAIQEPRGPWHDADRGQQVAEVFARGGYASLIRLKLAGYPLGDEGLLALSRSPLARQLVAFDLHADSNLSGEGVFALFDCALWPELRRMYFMPINSDRDDLLRLVAGDRFRTLDTFHVFFENATPKTAERFAANPHISGLSDLGFTGRHLGDAGARALIRSPYLSGLTALGLNGPGISEATMLRLADPATLPGLRSLKLVYLDHITPQAEAALRGRFGDGLEVDVVGA